MELFTKLFGSLLVFIYHCFDRIVIHGYLSGLSRPAQVVYFFRNVAGVPVVDKEVLSKPPPSIADGSRRLPAITRSRWSGRKKVSARKSTPGRCCGAWNRPASMGSTSFWSD